MAKKLKIIVTTFFLVNIAVTYSQQKSLEITYKRNDDKTVDFYYKKINPGSTYIELKFSRLDNTSHGRIIKKTIKGTSGSLFTLNPINIKKGIGFSYKYSYKNGDYRAKVNHDFKYVLPFKNEKEVQAFDMSYLGEKFGNKPPKNWKSIQFLRRLNDTVCASRKGIVVGLKNKFEADENNEYSYKREANYIIIEHNDGTLAKYGVLKKNSMMVKIGDKVYPSSPIAIAGTYDKSENSQLRLSVYYLDKEAVDSKKTNKQTLATKKHYYGYVNPLFYTEGNITRLISREKYITTYNDKIIEFEMSKREKKKRLKRKNK